ncbi:MAG TPA: choice-of-anchor Q domain-containing protein, partial [Polyangiaceae bacterium]
ADQTIYVGGGTTVAITVGDAEDSASSLNVQSSITGTGLASAAVDGSGANRTVTLVPGSSAGTANVTVSVTDSKGTTTTKTFKVTTVAAVVTSTADSGAGTLRDVATNVDAGAVITFDPSLNGKTITLSSSVTLPTSVKLQGPGPNLVTIAIGFNGGWTWPSAATVQGLTFQGTSSSTYVYVPMNATATVSGCAFVESQLTAGESTALTVTNSSFTSSSTAIALLESSVDRLTNVTISGTGTGIEILASGVDVAIASSTITSATSIILYEGSGTVTLRNSVVSGEIVNGFGTHVVQSLDYNLLASTPDPGAYTLAAHDQSAVDPKLDPLANYGGTTSTYRLQSTSPAVDAVPNASCVDASGNALTTDQRGKARPSGAACDIGAFERQPDDG